MLRCKSGKFPFQMNFDAFPFKAIDIYITVAAVGRAVVVVVVGKDLFLFVIFVHINTL